AGDRRGQFLDGHLPGPDRLDPALPRKVQPRSHLSGDLRRDPESGRVAVIAPGRAKRPGAARASLGPPSADELESCPFCAGHEEMTPPQTLVLPEDGGWRVRVVPNLYPALERQEVVVHSPRHVRSIAELEEDEVELVAEAWRRRRDAEPEGYLHALIN